MPAKVHSGIVRWIPRLLTRLHQLAPRDYRVSQVGLSSIPTPGGVSYVLGRPPPPLGQHDSGDDLWGQQRPTYCRESVSVTESE